MEFLQTLLSFAPVTTSSLIIVLALIVIACASVIFLKGVNFTLNSESWGKEVIDSGVLFDKLYGLLLEKHFVWEYKDEWLHLIENKGEYHFETKDGKKGLVLREYDHLSNDLYVWYKELEKPTVFKSKEDLDDMLKDMEHKIKEVSVRIPRSPTKVLLLPMLIDLCLFTFTLAPLLTITVVSTVTLVMSVRWVSGKLANNVKNTDINTKRIDDIEEKLKDE